MFLYVPRASDLLGGLLFLAALQSLALVVIMDCYGLSVDIYFLEYVVSQSMNRAFV